MLMGVQIEINFNGLPSMTNLKFIDLKAFDKHTIFYFYVAVLNDNSFNKFIIRNQAYNVTRFKTPSNGACPVQMRLVRRATSQIYINEVYFV